MRTLQGVLRAVRTASPAKDGRLKPSEHFERAVCDNNSAVVYCMCGRVHFSPSSGAIDEDELKDFLRLAKRYPKRYFRCDDADTVHFGEIDGGMAVIGCRCNGLRPYEDFIWENRFVIARYLNGRSKAELEEATEQVAQVTVRSLDN
jgi:hypothetical protein